MNEIDAIHTDIVKLTAQSDKLSKASKELRDKKTPISNILAYYQTRRKTPPFMAGDIRRVCRLHVSVEG